VDYAVIHYRPPEGEQPIDGIRAMNPIAAARETNRLHVKINRWAAASQTVLGSALAATCRTGRLLLAEKNECVA
jgi:glycerol kinase